MANQKCTMAILEVSLVSLVASYKAKYSLIIRHTNYTTGPVSQIKTYVHANSLAELCTAALFLTVANWNQL